MKAYFLPGPFKRYGVQAPANDPQLWLAMPANDNPCLAQLAFERCCAREVAGETDWTVVDG